jgi:hypothetical protein
MTTNTRAPENYYRIKFQGLPHDLYEYGATALEAIGTAKDELANAHTALSRKDLGNATARPAVYKEWTYGTEHYTNGGDFIKDTSKPCRECGTPVEFHTHATELGFCVDCSNAYFTHQDD